jgi:hypothetical protein
VFAMTKPHANATTTVATAGTPKRSHAVSTPAS